MEERTEEKMEGTYFSRSVEGPACRVVSLDDVLQECLHDVYASLTGSASALTKHKKREVKKNIEVKQNIKMTKRKRKKKIGYLLWDPHQGRSGRIQT